MKLLCTKAILSKVLRMPTILCSLACALLLAGCHNAEVKAGAPMPADVAYQAQYIRTNGYVGGKDYPVVTKIVSVKELEAYIKSNKAIYHLDQGDFQKAAARFDNEFFRGHMLVLVLLEEPSGSIRHELQSAKADGKNVAITIRRNVPQVGTDDMAEWHVVIAFDKAYSENTFSVEFM